ncbi:MAG TPA: transglycosylase SLT domain-containing protein [Gemmatimonadota bacterium]|nr:transglycosylase SLT domain-containing protein [Gemmatimonadota bacterium]
MSCPLYWRPGDPPGLFPHTTARVDTENGGGESAGGLADVSGYREVRAARGWIEVGRPDVALELLSGGIPDSPEARLYRLAGLAELGSWEEFLAALASAPDEALPAGCGPLVDRWSARSLMARGEGAAADRAFDRLADRLPALGRYVDLWRLESAAHAGDLLRGEAAWSRLEGGNLPRVASADARSLLPILYERARRADLARQWHLTLAAETRGAERASHWLAAVGLAEAAGDRTSADALRRRVVEQAPAAAAGIVLDPALRARLEIDPLRAARVLLSAGRAGAAEPFATAALEAATVDTRAREALLLRAEIRTAAGDRVGAERDYEATIARWPGDARVPEAAYELARLALDDRDGPVARRRLEDFLARFPSHPRFTAALYLLADSYQDDWSYQDDRRSNSSFASFADRAIELFDRVARDHSGSFFADRAEMRAAHLAYALGRYGEAERRYARYRGSESAREARYWLARAAAQQGEEAGAGEIYRSLARGDDYYALLARDRLAGRPWSARWGGAGYRPGPDAPAPGAPGGPAMQTILADPAGRTAAALLQLGERRYAAAELERAVGRIGGDRDRLEDWARALAAWGFPGLTLRIGVRLGASGAGERHAYPLGFAEAVDAEARAHGLDAYLLLALIRQESLFQADAESPVGARGLMQVMPATGREIADSTGWEGYDPGILYDPAVALHFGAHYLAAQLERFDGFWPAVLAAYNGGPHNVTLWMDFPERTQDPELWIDRIPFKETRGYVRKILAQATVYRRLYSSPAAAR